MKRRICVICGTEYEPTSWNPHMTPYCQRSCALEGMARRRRFVKKKCAVCGVEIILEGRNGLAKARKENVVCSGECKSEWSRRTIGETLLQHGGEITRYRKTNGMSRPEVRAKVSVKLRAMGWKPSVRGGNGKPMPLGQQALAAALGWPMEVAIPTGRKKAERMYPTCYKVDVGNEALKVAIEVDGNSHRTIVGKSRDAKKDAFLASIGWKVFRFTNEDVQQDLSGCVQAVLSSISK